jgi:hypothetical protein
MVASGGHIYAMGGDCLQSSPLQQTDGTCNLTTNMDPGQRLTVGSELVESFKGDQ